MQKFKNRIFGMLSMAALAIAALAITPDAGAQNAGTWSGLSATTLNGGTNFVAANTTNVIAYRLDVPRTENVYLQADFKLVGAGTSNVELIFARGSEAGYETNSLAIHKWNIAANGTTPVCGVTNIAVLGIPYLWVISEGHNNANAITNMQLRYGFKR